MDIANCPLYGKMCVITGELERYTRKEAYDTIRRLGGNTSDRPVNSMNFLILGHAVWSEMNDGIAPKKVQKAMELKEQGCDLEIISEDVFYSIVDEYFMPMSMEVNSFYIRRNILAEQLVSLNIPKVGEETARLLADHFANLAELVLASEQDLMKVPGIGDIIASSIYHFVRGEILVFND